MNPPFAKSRNAFLFTATGGGLVCSYLFPLDCTTRGEAAARLFKEVPDAEIIGEEVRAYRTWKFWL